MASKDLSNQVAATYKMLRLGLAVMAFGLPPILWIGGLLLDHMPLASSMSAYYHATRLHPDSGLPGQGVMRDELVGILFGVSGFLLAYQGYSKLEDYALNLAGILALGVALFPTPWQPAATDGAFTIHGACAILFFVAIGYVCIWRAGDTLPLIKDETTRKMYLRTYQMLGWAMVLLPLVAWVLYAGLSSRTFVVELAGTYVFATYWVVKSHEASKTEVDRKAACGMVRTRPHGLADALRPIPVTEDAAGAAANAAR